ncbi:hypothetical protein QQP08_026291 [Theobroma cacao]|nr:hypothetical protein QQP08_026291 [Theobroma cacao]
MKDETENNIMQKPGMSMLYHDCLEQLLRNRGSGHCKFILAYVSRAKMMDSMVITEATRHGMLINEVAGTRSVVANLEGVIFEITLC